MRQRWHWWPGGLLAVLAAWPGVASGFDCRLARSAVERLICSDDALVALDREQSAQYERLHRAVSPDGAATLLAWQRAFLASRAACLTGDTDQQVACMKQAYQEPGTSLSARFAQAGGLTLESRGSARRVARLRVSENESHPWLTGLPAARADAFNRYVTERFHLREGLFAATPIQLDPKPEGETQYDRSHEVHYMSSTLISIEVSLFHESYFGHGWRSEFALNWDLSGGRKITIVALFRPDTDWRRAVLDRVRDWAREDGSFNDPEDIVQLADPDDDEGWLFNEDGAVLLVGRGERSTAGTSADVPIPYEVLAPHLLPTTPLPVSAAR